MPYAAFASPQTLNLYVFVGNNPLSKVDPDGHSFCGAPVGVQQKLMRHAQVSTTMKYGNAYMTEKRKAHGAVELSRAA